MQGSEVKSLREGKVQLAESWGRVDRSELWLHNLHISPYSHAAEPFRSDPDRVRKLLAHRREILRLQARVDQERLALVPHGPLLQRGAGQAGTGTGSGPHPSGPAARDR